MSAVSRSNRSSWIETAIIVAEALAIAMFVRVFLYQPFNIPSGSMKETLLIGDYLFVSKLSYGYSRFSFPRTASLCMPLTLVCSTFRVLPDLSTERIFSAEPKRGDVAVFRKPSDTEIDYIKRVIGLPGDEIQMKDGVLYINGTAVPKKKIGTIKSRESALRPRQRRRLQRNAAERRDIQCARRNFEEKRRLRQHRALQGAGRALFHDGRQPRQFLRQP